MTQRLNFQETDPYAFQAILNIENYLATGALPPEIRSLIKLRASTLNNCTFCIKMHKQEADKTSLTPAQISDISDWKKSSLFTEQQQAILALTDAITFINDGVSTEVYQTALRHFNEKQIAQSIAQISLINTWNRIAISTQM